MGLFSASFFPLDLTIGTLDRSRIAISLLLKLPFFDDALDEPALLLREVPYDHLGCGVV
jgi:hypothetical protein